MAKRLLLWLFLVLPAGQVCAQQISARDVVHCLAAVDPLPVQYRTVMQADCLETALSLCLARVQAIDCVDGLIGAFRDFFYVVRPELPQTIPPGGYQPRLYRNAMRRIDSAFATQRPCGELSRIERARCRYWDISRATLDLFLAARAAGVAVTPRN